MDSEEHMALGALIGVGGYLFYKWLKQEPPSLAETVLSLIGGAMVGLVPDLLEPATSPNHRSLFHSSALLCLLAYGNHKVWQNDSLNEKQKLAVSLLSTAYGSHLVADSTTDKGIPLFL